MTSFALGPFRLDTDSGLLLRGTEPVALGLRAIALLRALVERPGALVSKDALIEAAWPGLAVEDSNLTVQIAALRRALGEEPGGDGWIETMPRRGYRFIGPVVTEAQNSVIVSRAERALPLLPDKPSIAVLPFENLPEASEAEIAEADTRHVGVLGKPPATLGTLGGGRRGRLPRRWLLWGGLGVIAGALCLAVFIGVSPGRPDHRLLSEDGPSIVVMPFRDFGGKGEFKLGDSIADGLARELSQLPGSQIVASETARAYSLKSLDARLIRRELGSAYIFAGSVASAQPGLHVEATLSKTLNGTVISPLTVDVDETDTGAARDNIVTGLIWPLASAIIREEGQRAVQKPAAAQTANDLVLLAWSSLNRNLPYDNAVEVLHFLEKALQIDKTDVDARALMANHLITQAHNSPKAGDYQNKLSVADSLLAEALIIQPSNMLAGLDRCMLRRAQTRYEQAIAICRELVDDLYRRPLAYKEIGWDYLFLGKPDQAIAAFTTADRLVKRYGVRWTWLVGGGLAYLQVGNHAGAIDWLRRALAERPRTYSARVWLIAAYALSERQQDAARELVELQRAHPELFSSDDALAQMISPPGSPAFGEHMRNVIEGLKKGGFPERMINPLLAKSLVPVGSQNSAGGSASR